MRKKSKTVEYFVRYDFPISLRIKPTNHLQSCYKCGSLIEKGTPQMKVRDGSWIRPIGDYVGHSDYESRCSRTDVKVKGSVVNGHGLAFKAPRFLYLHVDCFYCLMTKLLLDARLKIKTCEECEDRFKCFTSPDEIICNGHNTVKPKIFRKTMYEIQEGRLTIKQEYDKSLAENSDQI